MNDIHTPIPAQSRARAGQPRIDGMVQLGQRRFARRFAAVALGTTMLGVGLSAAVLDAAPSSARQIERRAIDAASLTGNELPGRADAGDLAVVTSPEVLRIECAAPAAVAGQRIRIGCRWTLPTDAPVRQLTLWRSVDGAVRERVATFGWPFENSYRDVVPAGTSRVAYAVIGTDGSGDLVARSRADIVRLPTRPTPTAVRPAEPAPEATTVVSAVPPAGSAAEPAEPVPVEPSQGAHDVRHAPSTTVELKEWPAEVQAEMPASLAEIVEESVESADEDASTPVRVEPATRQNEATPNQRGDQD